jgi:hypothetical protein
MAITIEQLLATLAIDEAAATVVSERIVLINRDPQPDEKNIAIDTEIKFLLVDLDADPNGPFPSPSFTIRINGDVVGIYGGGVFSPTPPWTGSVVATVTGEPFVGWHVTLIQPVPSLFESEEIVEVGVFVNIGSVYGYGPWGHFPYGYPPSSTTPLEANYEFEIEDLTPPQVLEAEAVDLFTIRVTFDDVMATEGLGSVLDLENWDGSITRLNKDPVPAVNLSVVNVQPFEDGNGEVFDLTVNWEMTQGSLYQIDVNPNIEDSSGNLMDPEASSVQFYGYTVAGAQGRNFNHWRMMVPLKNRQEDAVRDLERFSNCIMEVMGLLLTDVDRFTDQYDPDLATDSQIDDML